MHKKNGENGQIKQAFWVAGGAMVTKDIYREYIYVN